MEEHIDEDELRRQMEELLENMPAQLQVMEEGIDAKTMINFQDLQQSLQPAEIKEPLPEPQSIKLLAEKEDTSAFKREMVRIAEKGTVEAFRFLEQIAKIMERKELHTWANMSLLHCRMRVENELTDEPIGFIATGMGGKGDKIRYFFAVRALQGQTFSDGQLRWASQAFEQAITGAGADLEQTEPHEHYIGFTMLLSWREPVVEIIGQAIDECQSFIDSTFWITNVAKPSPEELSKWAKFSE